MNFYKLLLHGIILSSLPIQLFSMKYAVRFQKRLAFSRLENKKSLIDPFTILSEDIRVRVLIPLLEADNLIDTQKNQGSYAFINNQAYKEIISFYKTTKDRLDISQNIFSAITNLLLGSYNYNIYSWSPCNPIKCTKPVNIISCSKVETDKIKSLVFSCLPFDIKILKNLSADDSIGAFMYEAIGSKIEFLASTDSAIRIIDLGGPIAKKQQENSALVTQSSIFRVLLMLNEACWSDLTIQFLKDSIPVLIIIPNSLFNQDQADAIRKSITNYATGVHNFSINKDLSADVKRRYARYISMDKDNK